MALTEIKTSGIADDAVTTDKLANAINTERTANTAKSTNATHTGEVTGSGALTITDDTVDEANLKISNAGSNGQFLQKQSGNTGGLTWATPTDTNTVTTINNNADNRIITGSGTANTLEAESGLTYNGSTTLSITGSGQQQLVLGSTDAGSVAIVFDGDSNGDAAGGDYSFIRHHTDGDLEFFARNPSGATNTIFNQGTTEKMRIDSSGRVTIPSQPSFSVYNTTNNDITWSGGDDFDFNAEHWDEGGNYNTSNKRFTAPITGKYQFNFFTIIRNNDDNREIGITINGTTHKRILTSFSWQTGTSNYDYMSLSVLVSLSANDYVHINNTNSNKDITVHGAQYSGFSGYLVA